MKKLLLLPAFLICVLLASGSQNPVSTADSPAVVVVSHKWTKSRQVPEKLEPVVTGPVRAVIPANRNFERNRRANDPAGVRDPNLDTVDGRAAALEKIVQESRSPQPKAVDGYAYKIKVQNPSQRVVDIVFWEYQFIDLADPANVARRQFICPVVIRPGKAEEIRSFSLSGPSEVVTVDSLANKNQRQYQEKVVINRVEFADGTIWQRKDWNFAEVRLTFQRAVETPWGSEMCRGL